MAQELRARRKLLFGLITCFGLLGLAEAVLRVSVRVAPAATGFTEFRDLIVEMGGFADVDHLFTADPELLWRLRPSVEGLPWIPRLWLDNRSNSLGMRDPERSLEREPGSLRLLCLGDSCTYGTGVRLADSYPQLLEGILAPAYHDRVVEVWNGGVPGWSSDQGLVFFRRSGARVAPDLVVVSFGINDSRHWGLAHHEDSGHAQCRTDREARALLGAPAARLDRFFEHSALYRALRSLAARPASPADGPGSQRVPLPEFRENLAALTAEARARGAAVIFLKWPVRWQLELQPGADGLMETTDYQQALVQTGIELEVPVLDLVTALEGGRDLFVDSVHLNATGNAAVARALAEFLHQGRLLPQIPLPRR